MGEFTLKDLRKNREVVAEIERHKWFESEKAGYDIGFEGAADDWFKKFSSAWIAHNMPDQVKNLPRN